MKNFNKNLRNAFTLMEIGLSLLIISILIIVCIPIVVNQSKKTDEYSYFMAYKTVEKMGAQIVAFGDPSDLVSSVNLNYFSDDKTAFNTKRSISYSDILFKAINPIVYAATQTSAIISIPQPEYDYVRVCLGNLNVPKFKHESAGINYTQAEIDAINNDPNSYCNQVLKINDYEFIKKRFKCKNMDADAVLSKLRNEPGNSLSTYCKWLAQNCSGADDCTSSQCYKEVKLKSGTDEYIDVGYCTITVSDPDANSTEPVLGIPTDTTISDAVKCEKHGFLNTLNNISGSGFFCSCDAAHPIKALNNSSICCAAGDNDLYPYYNADYNKTNPSTSPCVYCAFGAYNEKTKSCCPDHSTYSSALSKCVCEEGYVPNSAGNPTQCNLSGQNCPAGSHLENNVCISNAPIIKAKRFCELVKYHWNVTNFNCNTFTTNNDISTYSQVYTEITKNNTPYLSAKAVEGAFRNIEPNIVFANGLMMWILGDKSASISGLSFNPDVHSQQINICKTKLNTGANSCSITPDFYCKNDARCFTIDNDGTPEGTPKLLDARSCCSTIDISDLIPLYEGTDYVRDPRSYAISGFTVFIDINGKKDNDALGGGGTLWKDVFPFYVAANGKVYPGYPLNAKKADDTKKDSASLYQGGNSSALSADVFYYDIVDGKRKKINVYPSVPYARALCFSLQLSAYTPYCQNLGTKYRVNNNENRIDNFIYSDNNPCYRHRCFVKLKNKIKFL